MQPRAAVPQDRAHNNHPPAWAAECQREFVYYLNFNVFSLTLCNSISWRLWAILFLGDTIGLFLIVSLAFCLFLQNQRLVNCNIFTYTVI